MGNAPTLSQVVKFHHYLASAPLGSIMSKEIRAHHRDSFSCHSHLTEDSYLRLLGILPSLCVSHFFS